MALVRLRKALRAVRLSVFFGGLLLRVMTSLILLVLVPTLLLEALLLRWLIASLFIRVLVLLRLAEALRSLMALLHGVAALSRLVVRILVLLGLRVVLSRLLSLLDAVVGRYILLIDIAWVPVVNGLRCAVLCVAGPVLVVLITSSSTLAVASTINLALPNPMCRMSSLCPVGLLRRWHFRPRGPMVDDGL